MDVKTLCLGVLSYQEATGYDIKKYFENAFSHFFPAGYGSIYPALSQLLENGHVTCTEQAQDKLPDKKIYRITSSGQAHFKAAIAAGNGSHKVRSEFLVQAYFAEMISPERLKEVVDSRVASWQASLDAISEHKANPEGWPAGVLFSMGFGEAMLAAATTYIRENRHLIEGASAAASHPEKAAA